MTDPVQEAAREAVRAYVGNDPNGDVNIEAIYTALGKLAHVLGEPWPYEPLTKGDWPWPE